MLVIHVKITTNNPIAFSDVPTHLFEKSFVGIKFLEQLPKVNMSVETLPFFCVNYNDAMYLKLELQ